MSGAKAVPGDRTVLSHVALASSSEENADRFFGGLLGLKKAEPKILPASLSQGLFGIDAELKVINYANDRCRFEIFILPGGRTLNEAARVEHVCLEIDGLEEFLKRCGRLSLRIIRVPKGDSLLTFVADDDGHLFELKERSINQPV